MIIVDYEALTVSGDFKGSFNSKDEMFKSIRAYVKIVGKQIPHQTSLKWNQNPTGILDNRPYIFKGRTNEGTKGAK